MTATAKTTAPVLPARKVETDPEYGGKYVKVQHVEGAAVIVTGYAPVQRSNGTWAWASATYQVQTIEGKPPRLITREGLTASSATFYANGKRAKNLAAAVRLILGREHDGDEVITRRTAREHDAAAPAEQNERPSRRRISKSARRADAAKPGSSLIEKDPETGLPRVKPEYQAKADAIVASQLARNVKAAAPD